MVSPNCNGTVAVFSSDRGIFCGHIKAIYFTRSNDSSEQNTALHAFLESGTRGNAIPFAITGTQRLAQ